MLMTLLGGQVEIGGRKLVHSAAEGKAAALLEWGCSVTPKGAFFRCSTGAWFC